jgi:hypothetical protein
MEVVIGSWFDDESAEDTENAYFVMVDGIPASNEHDRTSVPLVDGLSSREEAEIYVEIVQHYIATFPSAEHRLRQLANRYSEDDAEVTDVGQDQIFLAKDVAPGKFEN